MKIYPLFFLILISCGVGERQTEPQKGEKGKPTWTTEGDIKKITIAGTMQNSATIKSPLKVLIRIEEGTLLTTFLEYGTQPANLPESAFLNLEVKVVDKDPVFVEQFLFGGAMADHNGELLRLLLNQKDPVGIVANLSRTEKTNSTIYRYKIDPEGL